MHMEVLSGAKGRFPLALLFKFLKFLLPIFQPLVLLHYHGLLVGRARGSLFEKSVLPGQPPKDGWTLFFPWLMLTCCSFHSPGAVSDLSGMAEGSRESQPGLWGWFRWEMMRLFCTVFACFCYYHKTSKMFCHSSGHPKAWCEH